MNIEELKSAITAITRGSFENPLYEICRLLSEGVGHYDWVGYYLVKDEPRLLHLGPFVGEPTEHRVIPFGSGICGQAAERREVFVVPDVSAETNYLSCSWKVKSEIVVPIIHGERVLGEIDIDSHQVDPFTDEDSTLLDWVAGISVPLILA